MLIQYFLLQYPLHMLRKLFSLLEISQVISIFCFEKNKAPCFSCSVSYYQFVITNCFFPDCVKLARVTPIPRGGDSTNAGNYTDQFRDYRSLVKYLKKLRPIMAIDELPIMTTLNKVIYFMSVNMISENICLLHVQALLNHIQFMYDSIDSGNFVISVFFDS